jgi:hypothetical protein
MAYERAPYEALPLGCGPVAVSLLTGGQLVTVNRALADSGHDPADTRAGDLAAALEDLGGCAMWQIEHWDEWLAGPAVTEWLQTPNTTTPTTGDLCLRRL